MLVSRRHVLFGGTAAMLAGQSGMFANGEAYERFMGRWSRLVAPRLLTFADIGAEAKDVLDIGSGTGAMAMTIAAQNPNIRVTGIDLSPEFVAFANSKNTFGERVKFETGDAQSLPYKPGTFSATTSLLVFNFIPDPAKALREARRVTRAGGVIAAAVWDYGARMEMLRAFHDTVVKLDPAAERLDEKSMPLCRAGELRQLWSDGGLKQVSESPLDLQLHFSSFEDYWSPFLLGQGPAGAYVRKLNEQQRVNLRQSLMHRLRVTAEDAPLTLPARVHAVRGLVPAA